MRQDLGVWARGAPTLSRPRIKWPEGQWLTGLSRCAMAGGTWPQARRHKAGFAPSPTCPRCGEGPDTPSHTWWHCPALEALRVEHQVLDLRAAAVADNEAPRALWECGQVTNDWLEIPPPPAEDEDAPVARLSRHWPGHPKVTVYTDGACSDPTIPALRRAGWGVYFGMGLPGVSSFLTGRVQTAQRAELRALVGALEATQGWCEVVTDSAMVVAGCRHLAAGVAPKRAAHEDLWDRAAALWRPGVTTVRKIKAHLHLDDLAAGLIAPADWAGNRVADRLACQGRRGLARRQPRGP